MPDVHFPYTAPLRFALLSSGEESPLEPSDMATGITLYLGPHGITLRVAELGNAQRQKLLAGESYLRVRTSLRQKLLECELKVLTIEDMAGGAWRMDGEYIDLSDAGHALLEEYAMHVLQRRRRVVHTTAKIRRRQLNLKKGLVILLLMTMVSGFLMGLYFLGQGLFGSRGSVTQDIKKLKGLAQDGDNLTDDELKSFVKKNLHEHEIEQLKDAWGNTSDQEKEALRKEAKRLRDAWK